MICGEIPAGIIQSGKTKLLANPEAAGNPFVNVSEDLRKSAPYRLIVTCLD